MSMSSLALRIEPGKPLEFRAYCFSRRRKRTSPYYRVLIFRNVEELRMFALMQSRIPIAVHEGVKIRIRFNSRDRRKSYWKNCLGCARWFGEGTLPHRPKQIGVVLLARGYLTDKIIVHELTHAATYYVFSVGQKIDYWHHELLAHVAGELFCQFNSWYWKIIAEHRRRGGKKKK